MISAFDRHLSREKSEQVRQQVPASGVPPDRQNQPDPRLEALCAVDPGFDLDTFLTGAARAYEEILNLYANADLEALRPLIWGWVWDRGLSQDPHNYGDSVLGFWTGHETPR